MGIISLSGIVLEILGELMQASQVEEAIKAKLKKLGKAALKRIVIEQIEKDTAAEDEAQLTNKIRIYLIDSIAELRVAAESPTLAKVIKDEADKYPTILGDIAQKWSSLVVVEINDRYPDRLVAVPRYLLNQEALKVITSKLGGSSELQRLRDRGVLKEYFLDQLVHAFDLALMRYSFSPEKPGQVSERWFVVGFDDKFNWGSDIWFGHYYLHRTYGNNIESTDIPRIHREYDYLQRLLGSATTAKLDDYKKLFVGIST